MTNQAIPLDHDALSELLNDPVMLKVVIVLNLASLSILELLEYGLTRRDVNRALAKEVIEFEKTNMPSGSENVNIQDVVRRVPEKGDYYFEVLSSKVRLSKLGLYLLEILEADMHLAADEGDLEALREEQEAQFCKPAPQL